MTQETVLDTLIEIDGKAAALIAGRVPVDGSGVTQPVSGPLTDAQLRATPIAVSGTISATGGLTDTQLRASAVPVSGTVAATQSGSWSIYTSHTSSSRSDTYTAAASGAVVNVTLVPLKYFAIQVVQTGTVTSWTVILEGSLDGAAYAQMAQHTNVAGSGGIVWVSSASPVRYVRTRCSAIVLGSGTNVVATLLGAQ